MSRAYIYMEDPKTKDVVTLGRLTLKGAVGEFLYAPDHVNGVDGCQIPSTIPTLKGLAKFIEACEAVYDRQLDAESLVTLNIRQQRSSLGGARPKRTLQDKGMLILAKPRDQFDEYDFPSIEFACMTFAASKGMHVANTGLCGRRPSHSDAERTHFARFRLERTAPPRLAVCIGGRRDATQRSPGRGPARAVQTQVLQRIGRSSWEDELKAHYGKWLTGTDLHMTCDAVSSTRMTQ